MCYAGQGYEVEVPLPFGRLDQIRLSTLQELFDDRYEEAFGRRLSGYRARAITWRVEREVVLPGYGRCRARVERRPGLACGAKILGPALIDDTACTIAVPPSMEAAVDEMGNIVLSRQGRHVDGLIPSEWSD
jgi:N-methylhydantoinase A/oxoprolinase/acetone carboxylase beta subunit